MWLKAFRFWKDVIKAWIEESVASRIGKMFWINVVDVDWEKDVKS